MIHFDKECVSHLLEFQDGDDLEKHLKLGLRLYAIDSFEDEPVGISELVINTDVFQKTDIGKEVGIIYKRQSKRDFEYTHFLDDWFWGVKTIFTSPIRAEFYLAFVKTIYKNDSEWQSQVGIQHEWSRSFDEEINDWEEDNYDYEYPDRNHDWDLDLDR